MSLQAQKKRKKLNIGMDKKREKTLFEFLLNYQFKSESRCLLQSLTNFKSCMQNVFL